MHGSSWHNVLISLKQSKSLLPIRLYAFNVSAIRITHFNRTHRIQFAIANKHKLNEWMLQIGYKWDTIANSYSFICELWLIKTNLLFSRITMSGKLLSEYWIYDKLDLVFFACQHTCTVFTCLHRVDHQKFQFVAFFFFILFFGLSFCFVHRWLNSLIQSEQMWMRFHWKMDDVQHRKPMRYHGIDVSNIPN